MASGSLPLPRWYIQCLFWLRARCVLVRLWCTWVSIVIGKMIFCSEATQGLQHTYLHAYHKEDSPVISENCSPWSVRMHFLTFGYFPSRILILRDPPIIPLQTTWTTKAPRVWPARSQNWTRWIYTASVFNIWRNGSRGCGFSETAGESSLR